MTKREREKAEAKEALKRFIRRGTRVYTTVRHVSRSGMQRAIQVFVIHKGDPVDLSWRVAELLGWSVHSKGGVKVDGCGMDMGFHVVNALSYAMFDGLARTRRNPVDTGRWTGSGYKVGGRVWRAGYELNHRWL